MERWKWSGKPRSSADNALKAFLNNWQSFIWVFIPLCFLSWCVGSDIENLPLTRGWQGDAAWAGCEPQDLDVGCEMEQKYCWLKETAPCATFQRHCSSVPQKHVELHSLALCVCSGVRTAQQCCRTGQSLTG